jgi:hypothetical protein
LYINSTGNSLQKQQRIAVFTLSNAKFPETAAFSTQLFISLATFGGVWHNTQDMSRWIGFILAILVGAAAGMLYGWVISPVEYVDTTPQTLRVDYKSDYVLMVAEAYSTERDLAIAVTRLAALGSDMPAEIVRQAILFAESQGYTDADVALMRSLGRDLDTWNPTLPGQTP